MTPEREKLIRSHWAHYGHMARDPLLSCGIFRTPVRKPVSPYALTEAAPVAEKVDVLEFKMEDGYLEDRPMMRIVCEGVEVEIGPRLQRS